MRIKRYVASEMRRAIRLVREELGPDAVILSNRQVEGGVELTAAIDLEDTLEGPVTSTESRVSPQPETPSTNRPQTPKSVKDGRPSGGVEGASSPADASPSVELVAVDQELKTLRGLLERQLSGLAWGDFGRRHPLGAKVFRQLMGLGLSRALAQDIGAELSRTVDPRSAWRKAIAILTKRINVTGDDLLTQGGIVALLGPTGVGKTTTVAKLAARFALRHDASQVGLITTDSFRVGAHEQLRTFGRIMRIPVRVANDHNELRDALGRFSDRGLVLIDTAGMSQRDVRFSEQVALIGRGSSKVKRFLVLSATSQMLSMDETLRALSGAPPHACVVTKIDEATSLGAILSTVVQHKIPVAYLSHGQRVPEDITLAHAHQLVNEAVTITCQVGKQCDEESLELAYGGLQSNARY